MEEEITLWNKGKPLTLYPIFEYKQTGAEWNKHEIYCPFNIIQLADKAQENILWLGYFPFCMN